MTQSDRPAFRRPAMLWPEVAESFGADTDPSKHSHFAHATAWALMGLPDSDLGENSVEDLRGIARSGRLHMVAALWAQSPPFTLPGAFWRLFLLHEWYRNQPDQVAASYARGSEAEVIPGLERPVRIPDLGGVIGDIHTALTGGLSEDDLAPLMSETARVLRILAAGEGWVDFDPTNTVRAQALLSNAEDLDQAANEAEAGTLE